MRINKFFKKVFSRKPTMEKSISICNIFPDKNLAKMIAIDLGYEEDEVSKVKVTKDELLKIERFSHLGSPGSSGNIKSIEGFQLLINLKCVILRCHEIKDLTPLANLKNLERLALNRGLITDITPLKDLKKLNLLNMQQNKINDISPLSGLINLEHLDLSYNFINDTSSLSELKKLEYLSLKINKIENISSLSELTNLKHLTLCFNKIKNIDSLKKLTNLISLHLSDNNISDLTALSKMKQLNYLELKKKCDWNTLPLMESLTELKVCRIGIPKVSYRLDTGFKQKPEILSNLTKLNMFKDYDSSIQDFSFIVNLPQLEKLTLQ